MFYTTLHDIRPEHGTWNMDHRPEAGDRSPQVAYRESQIACPQDAYDLLSGKPSRPG